MPLVSPDLGRVLAVSSSGDLVTSLVNTHLSLVNTDNTELIGAGERGRGGAGVGGAGPGDGDHRAAAGLGPDQPHRVSSR